MRVILRWSLLPLIAVLALFTFKQSSRTPSTSTGTEPPTEPPAVPVAVIETAKDPKPANVAPPLATNTPAEAFAAWSQKFMTAAPEEKEQLLAEGNTLGLERRAAMENLIKTDPRAALEQAVPDDVRRALPESIQSLLEERVSGRGFYGVKIADYEDARREIKRDVVLNHRRYDAYVYGDRSSQTTRENELVWGIAVGRSLAVHESPVRRLSKEESAGLDPSGTCPVSGVDPKTSETPAFADVGGKVERFCGAGHLAAYSDRLAADGGLGGEGESPIAKDGWTQGPRRVLFMRVAYPDDPTEAITEAGAYALMDATSAWFSEVSYNSTWLVTDVTPLMILPQNRAWYCDGGDYVLLNDAREVARSYGYDLDNYHLDIVRFSSPGGGCNGFGYAGQAYVRGKGCWMLSNSTGVQIHELGHNYGVWHANYWTGLGDGIISHGSHVEYGNPYDVMGSSGGLGHFNIAFKNILDWAQDSYVHTVSTSGTYRIHTFDVPSLTDGNKYGLKIRKDYDRNYWAEFRRKNANAWFLNGIILNWDDWNNGVTNSGSGTHLLDTTPGTPAGNSSKDDCPVTIGRTYSDVASGVHITPIARGDGSLPENWIDVVVNLGNSSTNVPPTNHLIADRLSAPLNSAINFSSIASDSNGDALAYAWDFGDQSFGPNSANVSRAWGTAGLYNVRCTVSDMKGGVSTKYVVVAIGSPTTFRASGRVTLNGVGLEGVRVHNGQSAGNYRAAYTDSDGYYTVANLAAGSHNLNAVKYGYALPASGWSNPINVGPDAVNRDFVANPLPAVGFTLLDTNMGEASLNPGMVRITRSGNVGSAINVRLNRTGSASTGDYTMSPAPSGTPLQVAFAAGVTNVDITLNPTGDSTVEGPEFIVLTLIEDPNYVIAPSAEVRLVLNDDESAAKPTVSASASSSGGSTADNVATESGNDTGVFLFTRTGNVSNELLVQYTVGGTAASGVDFTPMSGVVSISAGATTGTVIFRALDDAEVEGNETVSVTIVANAAYNVGGGTPQVTILDDDPTTVTVVATDNVASETSGNPGTVIFNRVGSITANLVVNYALSGSASNGADYTLLTGSITIPAGRPNVSLAISPTDDVALEGEETVVVRILSSAAYNVGDQGSAKVVIQDNELSTVTLTASDSTAAEASAETGSYRLVRTLPSSSDLTVFYSVSGDAVPGRDYQALSGSAVFPAGVTSIVLTVTPIDDTIRESSERVMVSLVPNSQYSLGTVGPVIVTITDNDSNATPAVGFSMAASQGLESDVSVGIHLHLSGTASGTVSVNYAVTGSATGGGTDYTLTNGTVTFTDNDPTLSISINNDTLSETNETIVITLSNPVNAVLDAFTNHVYTIIDDDTSGALTISTPDATANEAGQGIAIFRLTRSVVTANPQTVNLQILGSASAPSDYAPLPTTAVIPAGSNSVDLIVVPVDDSTDETNETVTINVLPSPGIRLPGTDTATISIVDDDDSNLLPIVRVSAVDASAAEPGTDTGTFRITRDRGSNAPLTIEFTVGGSAASGTDYTNLGTTVTLPVGVASTNITVFPRNDSTFETNETIVLSLSVVAAYRVDPMQASATVTLVDDEQGVFVTGSGVSAEGGSTHGTFLVTRTGSTVSNLSVNFRWAGTASTTDFTPNGTNVVIPAGTNVFALAITATSDANNEGAETLVLALSTNAAYTVLTQHSATITLVDSAYQSPWNFWRASHFSPAELSNPSISGADGDPDTDGRRNLLEYAFNRNPKTSDVPGGYSGCFEILPNPPGQQGYVVRFTRRKAPTDLVYQLEVTSNFSSWESGVAVAQEIPATDDGNGITETAAFHILPGATGQRFVRLNVTLTP